MEFSVTPRTSFVGDELLGLSHQDQEVQERLALEQRQVVLRRMYRQYEPRLEFRLGTIAEQ